ncbi:MAG: hypothetical protein Q8M29_15515 [Bacteroidota bacterium]|nr:hypothetical protein [Bacteroidota bacterium]
MKIFRLLILLSVIFVSCKTKKAAADYTKEGYVKATVIKYEVESCGYILQLEGEKKLMPQNLADEFKKDKLVIWIKYETPKKQPMTTCMAGTVVKLTDVKKD